MIHDKKNIFHYQHESTASLLNSFVMRVYAWMMTGLLTTALTAYTVFSNEYIFISLMSNKFLFYGLFILQIVIVFALPAIAQRSHALATIGFFAYAALLGLSLSSIFALFHFASIVNIFGIASGMFGCMALYGYFTKADLTGFGSIMYMGLFGLIIASLVNLFFASPFVHYLLSFIGIIIFTGLTAYDMQKIKYMGIELIERGQSVKGMAVLGALTLYLDFINLFLHLLSFLGDRKK